MIICNKKRVAKSFVKQHRAPWGYFVSTFEGPSWNQPNLCQGMMDAFRAGKTALEDWSTIHTPGGRFPRMITSKDDEPYSNPILIQSTLIWKLWTSRDVLLLGRFGDVHWELYGFVLRWFLGPGSFLKPLAKICREKFICGEPLSHCQISQKVCQRRNEVVIFVSGVSCRHILLSQRPWFLSMSFSMCLLFLQ